MDANAETTSVASTATESSSAPALSTASSTTESASGAPQTNESQQGSQAAPANANPIDALIQSVLDERSNPPAEEAEEDPFVASMKSALGLGDPPANQPSNQPAQTAAPQIAPNQPDAQMQQFQAALEQQLQAIAADNPELAPKLGTLLGSVVNMQRAQAQASAAAIQATQKMLREALSPIVKEVMQFRGAMRASADRGNQAWIASKPAFHAIYGKGDGKWTAAQKAEFAQNFSIAEEIVSKARQRGQDASLEDVMERISQARIDSQANAAAARRETRKVDVTPAAAAANRARTAPVTDDERKALFIRATSRT